MKGEPPQREIGPAEVLERHNLSRRANSTSARFAITYVLSCAAVLVAVFCVNFAGNSDDLYPNPYRPANSDRAWKSRRLEELVHSGNSPYILILGSSRMQQMCPRYIEALTNKSTFNYAVTGGSTLDCVSQLRFALRIGVRPQLIILNVDESMLTSDVAIGQLRLAGHKGLFAEVPLAERSRIIVGVLQGIGFPSTWRNLLALLVRHEQSVDERVLRQRGSVFLEDGYLIHHGTAARCTGKYDLSTIIDAEVKERERRDRDLAHRQERPSFLPSSLQHLRELLALAALSGSDVRVIITPEHPSVSGTMLGLDRKYLLEDLQSVLASECRLHKFKCFNFSDLSAFGGDPDEFWDGTHQTPVNMRRMTDAVFGIHGGTLIADSPSDCELLRTFTSPSSKGWN